LIRKKRDLPLSRTRVYGSEGLFGAVGGPVGRGLMGHGNIRWNYSRVMKTDPMHHRPLLYRFDSIDIFDMIDLSIKVR